MTVEPLLTTEWSEPGSLGEIAVIALDDVQFHVEPAEADKANDVVEAHRGATGFPTCNGGLGGAGAVGEFGLREAGTPTGLPDQISAVRRHTSTITDLL